MANRYALLIGNTDYEDPALRKLKAPEADVRTLAELLGAPDLGGYHVTTLLNQPKHEVEVAIGDLFADKHPDDLLLLYFTGHGVLYDPGRLYLAVISTRADRPKATGLSAAWLKTEMDDSRAFRQVLLLDCCHSGAFTSGGAKGAEGLNRPAILDDTFGEKGRGRVVLTATDKTSAAWEGEKIIGGLEHSLFTHFVIVGLRTGAAADEQGRVTSDSLYAYVFRAIVAATNKQRPRQIVYDREGEIVIARSPRPPAPQAAGLPAEVRQAIERAVFQDPRRATSEKTYFLESLKPNPDRLKLTAP
ncbi:MAG: caspase family protein, partial [Anaerolineales bacterium]